MRVIALEPHDAARALPLSQALKWPYRLEDWQSALSLGEGVGIELDGELCATGLCWSWGDAYATVGMIIVDGARQARGLGRRIMDELLARTGERSVVLRSTREGYRLYEQLGFVPFGNVHQHQAPGAVAAASAASAASAAAAPVDRAIRDLRPDDVEPVARLDHAASAMDRDRLLQHLRTNGRIVVLERDGAVTGYACVRRWGRGVVIGPVIASDATDAQALIGSLTAQHAQDFVRIDVTDASGLSPWLEQLGLPCVDRVVSMARGAVPQSESGAMPCALANQSLG